MFDYVIVGAGSAGCVLANRLSADPRVKVALLEAGGPDHRSFKVRAPALYQLLWRTPLDWAFMTEPQQHVANRTMFWPRGKLLGGTSCLNAMIYIRGHRANYDAWRDLGNPGWGWDDVLPYFQKSEDNVRGASDHHGAGGPLHVSDAVASPVAKLFVEAAAARCNVPVTDDFNGAEQIGAGHYQLTTRAGVRASTATGFLDPVRGRENLTVITNALATGLVVDGDRVTGVRYRVAGRATEEVASAGEVILTGGAIGSPHLLMLSGIGAADELRAAGVESRHELPGVGKHLQDHLLALAMFRVTATNAAIPLTMPRLLTWMAQHLLARRGPLTRPPVDAGAFVRSHPEAPLPDNQFHFTPFGVMLPTDRPTPLPVGRLASILPGLIYPRSHGEIRLRSANPTDPPAIDPRYFSDPADLDHLLGGIKLAREIAATAPLAGVLGEEVVPGPGVRSDDELRDAIRAHCNTIFHPTGTCRMGQGAGAVVDARLRVHGLRGVRVADASVMPSIIGGNTNAPTIMIAEKASDMIAEDR